MPIDWRETLGDLDQSTAATLARRQLEQQALLNVIKEQDALRNSASTRATNEEVKKANAALTAERTQDLQLKNAVNLNKQFPIGTDLTNNPAAQKAFKDAGIESQLQTTPGTLPSTQTLSAASGLPAGQAPMSEAEGTTQPGEVSLVAGIQQAKAMSGEAPKVVTTGSPEQQREQLKTVLIDKYISGSPEEKAKAQTELALKFGIKQFGTMLYGPGPNGVPQMLGEVPVGTGVKTITQPGTASLGGQIDPTTVDAFARQALRSGTLQGIPLGRGGLAGPVGQQVSARMAELLKDPNEGFSSDLASTKTLAEDAKKNYAPLSKQGAQLMTAANTANDNLQLVLEAAPTIKYKTDSPWVNQWVNKAISGAGFEGAKELSDYEVKVYTAIREYAKVTSGSYNSVAELSAAAAKHAQELLNAAQNPAQAKAAVQAMQQDMFNVTSNFQKMLQDQRQIIATTGKTTGAGSINPDAKVTPTGDNAPKLYPVGTVIIDGKGGRKTLSGAAPKAIPPGWHPE